jgi:hypothetical protein
MLIKALLHLQSLRIYNLFATILEQEYTLNRPPPVKPTVYKNLSCLIIILIIVLIIIAIVTIRAGAT